jgi:hypothetical protein
MKIQEKPLNTTPEAGAKERPDRNPASCKIQYPMKNRDKDATIIFKSKLLLILFF